MLTMKGASAWVFKSKAIVQFQAVLPCVFLCVLPLSLKSVAFFLIGARNSIIRVNLGCHDPISSFRLNFDLVLLQPVEHGRLADFVPPGNICFSGTVFQ